MKLKEYIVRFQPDFFQGDLATEVAGLAIDSRKVKPGYVFFAIQGTQFDGHDFIDQAIENGATCIVCSNEKFTLYTTVRSSMAWVAYSNVARACGFWSNLYYGEPHTKLKLIGITGTNGKTTVATLCHEMFTEMGYKCGLLSTIENRVAREVMPAKLTTPDALNLNKMLSKMTEKGCSFAFMEVSSHAIDQERIAGLEFSGAVFTNISHDHLDYHATFQDYINTKKRLFDKLPAHAFALINTDDKRADYMVQNCKADAVRYGLKGDSDYPVRIVENGIPGLHLLMDGTDFHSSLLGEFNASNLLAVYCIAMKLGIPKNDALLALSNQKPVPGRFECIYNATSQVLGVVDYAHTPDALEKILRSVDAIKQGGRIYTVVGCGGNRDTKKRPLMAKIAVSWSDRVIFTSDNPRDEDPNDILKDMERGVPPEFHTKYIIIPDRGQAIKAACAQAAAGDVIVIAGKGHEQYQEVKGVRHEFDDRKELRICFEGLGFNWN